MGKNNQQRRAAKRRQRQAAARRRPPQPQPGSDPPDASAGRATPRASEADPWSGVDHGQDPGPGRAPRAGRDPRATAQERSRTRERPGTQERSRTRERPPTRQEVEDTVDQAVRVIGRAPPPVVAQVLDRLLVAPALAFEVLDDRLARELDSCFARGWTPADLVQVGGRSLDQDGVGRLTAAVVADGRQRSRRREQMHQRWRDQLEELAPGADAHLAQDHRRPPRDRVLTGCRLLALLWELPELPATLPPPGSTLGAATGGSSRLDPRMTARVRALLAKAESTTFEDEAEAFTAKAQELIARHAIDEALLHEVDDVGDPSVRRLVVDDPYADAKASLIASVARANRCRVVYSPDFGWVTAIAYDHDLDAVELLATSLLTQATAAMTRHGPVRDASGRSRTRSFRRSFLFGFGHRIGERLLTATDQEVAASVSTEAGEGRLLPVLAAREDRLDEAQAAAFPDLVSHRTTISNGSGWRAGKAAAELADLDLPAPHLPPR